MHFNIYLDDQTGRELAAAAQETGETRNALIRQAVQEWLDRHGKTEWPEAVRGFEGLPEMPPFEENRIQLKPPARDPLA
jgi:hypothetical protein